MNSTAMSSFSCRLLFALAALTLLFASAKAEPSRAALVIGNGAYRAVPALRNPTNDARSIATLLTKLGFETELLLDSSKDEIIAAVRRLRLRASRTDAAVLFYAGHATEIDGNNYLLPIDVVSDRSAIQRQAVSFSSVMDTLSGAAATTLIILDACRDNPFSATSLKGGVRRSAQRGAQSRSVAGTQGLAQVESRFGMLVAFATAPGEVALDGDGDHSPFTAALMRHVAARGVEVRQMLDLVRQDVRAGTGGRQIPWDNSSLERGLYLNNSTTLPHIYDLDGVWGGRGEGWSLTAEVQNRQIRGRIEACLKTNTTKRWSAIGPEFRGIINQDGTISAKSDQYSDWRVRDITGRFPFFSIRAVGSSSGLDCPDGSVTLRPLD